MLTILAIIDVRRDLYNTMEKILKAPEAVAPETVESTDAPATEVEAPQEPVAEAPAETTPEPDSTSTEDDYDALIEDEKKRGVPDPEKAKERFISKKEVLDEDEPEDEDDKPMTKREAREFLAQQSHQTLVESNTERIIDYSESIADSPQQAEYMRQLHKNRTYPSGMSIREQMEEVYATANFKREQAKNIELARKIQSQDTASRDTATTHRDPQAGTEPKLESDMKTSLTRVGYTFNNQTRNYEKKLPNGNLLVTPDGKNPQIQAK
jgi:hypothetical protein